MRVCRYIIHCVRMYRKNNRFVIKKKNVVLIFSSSCLIRIYIETKNKKRKIIIINPYDKRAVLYPKVARSVSHRF